MNNNIEIDSQSRKSAKNPVFSDKSSYRKLRLIVKHLLPFLHMMAALFAIVRGIFWLIGLIK